jgi:RNA polymerase sigma-70 factor (ECF subfamily)
MSSRLISSSILPALRVSAATEPGNSRSELEEKVAALFDQLRKPQLRYLSSFGLALPDGEEVLQDVFLSLFQHLDRGRPNENIRAWLFRAAHNLALRRRLCTRRDSENRAGAYAEDLALDPEANPEDQLANRQTRQRLLAVVEAFPEQHRRCLFLRAEGLRYREIAGILGISLGAVSLSLARSLAGIARSAERYHL